MSESGRRAADSARRAARLLRWYPKAWRSRYGQEFAELGFGGAIWSQLTVGWQWSRPAGAGTAAATFVLSGAMLAFAVLALLAALPVAWNVASRLARGPRRGLPWPILLLLAGLVVVVAGGRHFGNGWPGTGGHWPGTGGRPWDRQDLVPGGVAVFLCGCCAWLADRAPGPGNLFHAGTIDVAGVVTMALALEAGRHTARHTRRAARQAGAVPG